MNNNEMNNKELELYRIVDIVVECCAMQVDDTGRMSVTREDVLGKSRAENVVMTRCILVHQLVGAGFSTTTAAQLLHRTTHAVRHLLEVGDQYMKTSRAYRIANAEATLRCKDIDNS